MSTIEVKNTAGKAVGKMELDDLVFAESINEHLLWETVKWQRAKKHQGTHSSKTRGESVARRRKSTSKKAPAVLVTVRGKQTFSLAVVLSSVLGLGAMNTRCPKRRARKPCVGALSLRLLEAKLVVIDEFQVSDGKTASVAKALSQLGSKQPESRVLIVDESNNTGLIRGTRNLRASKWITPEAINVYDVLDHETLIMTKASVESVVAALRP